MSAQFIRILEIVKIITSEQKNGIEGARPYITCSRMLNQSASLKVSISQPYLPVIFQDTPFWIQEGLLIPILVSVFMGIFFRPTCFSQEQCLSHFRKFVLTFVWLRKPENGKFHVFISLAEKKSKGFLHLGDGNEHEIFSCMTILTCLLSCTKSFNLFFFTAFYLPNLFIGG